MEKAEFLMLMDEIIEAEPGTLKVADELIDVEGWDSMAVMGLIAMVDEKFGITMVPEKIAKSKTVADIIALLGENVK